MFKTLKNSVLYILMLKFYSLIRYTKLKRKNKTCSISLGVVIDKKTKLGKNIRIGTNTKIVNCSIGDNVSIGSNVVLVNTRIGINTQIEGGVKTVGPRIGYITIGKECYIGVNNILDTSDNIRIGDYVHIAGPSTALWCHSSAKMCLNSISLKSEYIDEFRPTSEIIVESNVYIGGNCTIYPNTIINHHSITAPNAVVTKDVESFILVGGVPAKIIKKLDLYE